MAKILALLLIGTCITSCVSVVNVAKVAPDNAPDGITYFLPQVFLMLTPAPDGSMKVETIYLPDPAHQYSVKAYSVLGSYTIDVNRSQEGFLDTVNFNSDNTGMTKQLLSSDANLRAADIDASAASVKVKEQEDKIAADKAAAAIAAGEKAQAEAALAVQVAQSKLDYLNSLSGTPADSDKLREQIVAATLALREAQVKYSAALAAHSETVSRYQSANAPIGRTLKAPEPMFLKVNMTKDSVSLSPAFKQEDRETWKIPVEAKSPVEFEILPNMVVMRPAVRTGALTATVQSTLPIVGLELDSVSNVPPTPPLPTGPGNDPFVQLQFDRRSIKIDMPKKTPAGTYRLKYAVQVMEGDKQVGKTAQITVRIEK